MALGRDGIAWVEYTDGRLFRVEVDTGVCSPTAFVPDQASFTNFGMGFAADAPGSDTETLYIANGRLGRIDLSTLVVQPLPALPYGGDAELTGTGDAELWGFFRGTVPHMGHIDKTTATLAPDFALTSLGDLSRIGFAFGFFGGDFYAFVYDTGSTRILRIDRSTGAVNPVLDDTGYHIVGAGVSTCAPTT
jgi:hypothetical protein